MSLVDFVFGRRAPRRQQSNLEVIERAPAGAWWREIRPTGAEIVRAEKEGDHVTVTYPDGDAEDIRQDIFDKTYRQIGGAARYKKRTDVVLRYFTLDRPVMVRTLEGMRRADAGDWIIEGVAGELWPVPRDEALRKYAPL